MIQKIEQMNNASQWFNSSSRWYKMLNELQESDQFTNTVSLIDSHMKPCSVFVGTYGFYNSIYKTQIKFNIMGYQNIIIDKR